MNFSDWIKEMRFPKQLVILGYILIAAAIGAGVYDSFREKKPAGYQAEKLEGARRMTDLLFKRVFEPFKNIDSIPPEFYEAFKSSNEAYGTSRLVDIDNSIKSQKGTGSKDGMQLEEKIFLQWQQKFQRSLLGKGYITQEQLDKLNSANKK